SASTPFPYTTLFRSDSVLSVNETLGGELYIAGFLNGPGLKGFRIGFRSGAGFQSIAPRIPKSINDFGWRPARTIVQDHAGEWWRSEEHTSELQSLTN